MSEVSEVPTASESVSEEHGQEQEHGYRRRPQFPGRNLVPDGDEWVELCDEEGVPLNRLLWDDDGWLELCVEGVPLGRWSWDDLEEIWIFDEFPPLGTFGFMGDDQSLVAVPQLGVGTTSGVYLLLLIFPATGIGVALWRLRGKKGKRLK